MVQWESGFPNQKSHNFWTFGWPSLWTYVSLFKNHVAKCLSDAPNPGIFPLRLSNKLIPFRSTSLCFRYTSPEILALPFAEYTPSWRQKNVTSEINGFCNPHLVMEKRELIAPRRSTRSFVNRIKDMQSESERWVLVVGTRCCLFAHTFSDQRLRKLNAELLKPSPFPQEAYFSREWPGHFPVDGCRQRPINMK